MKCLPQKEVGLYSALTHPENGATNFVLSRVGSVAQTSALLGGRGFSQRQRSCILSFLASINQVLTVHWVLC